MRDWKKFENDNNCYICEGPIENFSITPLLELPDGSLRSCCEKCADREFPGWEK